MSRVKMNGRQENFLLDNLASISRNETEYGNEPDVTGGNPILADGDLLFNNLLDSAVRIFIDGDTALMAQKNENEVIV